MSCIASGEAGSSVSIMNLPVYTVREVGPLTKIQAKTWVNAYGLGCKLEFTVFAVEEFTGLRMSFAVDPEAHNVVKTVAHTSRLVFNDVSTTGHRQVEQHITMHPVEIEPIVLYDLRHENPGCHRILANDVIRALVSVINYARQSVFNGFADDFRYRACKFLDEVYGKAAEKNVTDLLSSINWPLLFSRANVPEWFVDWLESTFREHRERIFYPLLFDGDIDAEILVPVGVGRHGIEEYVGRILEEHHRQECQDQYTGAAKKARFLLRRVCGEEIYQEYIQTKRIFIKKPDGWRFSIGDLLFIDVWDPEGNSAKICVHTARQSCHSIDEIVISYLHLMHDCADFLARANVHSPDEGFDMRPFERRKKRRGVHYGHE